MKSKSTIIVLVVALILSGSVCYKAQQMDKTIEELNNKFSGKSEALVNEYEHKISDLEGKISELEEQQNRTKQGLEEIQGMVNTSVPLPIELQLHTAKTCKQYGIDPKILYAIMYKESRYKLDLVSSTNDYGVCQINASNANWLKRDYGLDIYSPKDNITAGVVILKLNLDKADGDIRLALGGYNTGRLCINRYSDEVMRRV